MFFKAEVRKAVAVSLILWAFLLSSLPVGAQDLIASSSITGGSSVFVFRKSRKAKKRSAIPRRNSRAKRSKKQRRATKRRVVRQSRSVAKKNRDRRSIDKVTPQDFAKIEIKRKSAKEASKIFAGLAEYRLERDDIDKAVLAYEEAVTLDQGNQDARLGLSEVYTRKGDEALENDEYGKARRYYDQAIKYDPKNSSAYAGRGQFFDETDQEEKAKADYLKALEIDPGMSQVKAPLGIIYYQEGEIAKSDEYIAAALKDGADNAETQYFLGLIRYKQGRDKEAETALRKSISIDDSNDDAHYYLGAVLNRLGREKEAVQEFEKATKLDEKYVPAWFDLGVAYYNQERWNDSIGAFKNAIKFNTNRSDELKRIYIESYANMAEAYRQLEDLNNAIANYRIATAQIKDDAELYTNFGFVLGRKERWNPAIDAFKKAAELQPDAISYANLGWAHYNKASYDKSFNQPKDVIDVSLRNARPALEKAVEYDPQFVAALLNLGVVLNDLGEHDAATDSLEKVNSLRKNWLPAMSELGVAYIKLKKYNQAIKQFKKVIKEDKKNVWALYFMAEAELNKGNKKEARKLQSKLRPLSKKLADRLETMFVMASGS